VKAERKQSPTIHIVAGPNGAGKTTFALTYLRQEGIGDFINADMIALGLAPLSPESVQIEAGRIFLKLLEDKIKQRKDFAFETTLSGHLYLKKIPQWKAQGWRIVLHFLWIPNAEFSKLRVLERVRQGGHGIPEDVVLRRYERTLKNLGRFCAICNYVVCYDNSRSERERIFSTKNGLLTVENASLYEEIVKNFR